MDVEAFESKLRARGVEILVFYLVYIPAVRGISELGAEAVKVEQRRAVSYLFIRAERNAYPSVRYILFYYLFSRGHYLRYARLVVRAEHGSAVRHDERFACMIFKRGKIRGRKHSAAVA